MRKLFNIETMKVSSLVIVLIISLNLKAQHACDDTVADLVKYSNDARTLEGKVADYLNSEGNVIGSWHNYFQKNIEGRTVTISPGFFKFVKDESDILLMNSDYVRSQSKGFKGRFDQLIQNLKSCLQ